jgi:tryptophanyl-tRNA synthetase
MKAEIGCVECKHKLVDSIAGLLEPFQEARTKLADKDDYVREVLYEGAKKAHSLITKTVQAVREKMGIVLFERSRPPYRPAYDY